MNTENEDEGDDRFEGIRQFQTDPLGGLFRIISSIEKDRQSGDQELEHSGLDVLTDVLISLGQFLDVAEAIARKLVNQDADAAHLTMLANVLEKTGRTAEAAECRKRASVTTDSHDDPKIKALVKERMAKYSKKG